MEELQLIVATLNSLGEGAKDAFIFWMLCRYVLEQFVVLALVGSMIFCVYKIVIGAIRNVGTMANIKKIMDMDGKEYLNRDDLELIYRILKEGKPKP